MKANTTNDGGPPTTSSGSSSSSNGPPTQSSRNLNYTQNLYGLLQACKRNDVAGVGNLLKSVNPNEKGSNGNTPLHEAATAGALQVVQALLNARANPLIKNDVNDTPLDVAMNAMMSMNNPTQQLIDTVDLL